MLLNAEQLKVNQSEWVIDEGMRKLIICIINEAAHTLRTNNRKQTEKLLKEKQEAKNWFLADEPDQVFSFLWCCAVLGKNPAKARANLFGNSSDIEDTRQPDEHEPCRESDDCDEYKKALDLALDTSPEFRSAEQWDLILQS